MNLRCKSSCLGMNATRRQCIEEWRRSFGHCTGVSRQLFQLNLSGTRNLRSELQPYSSTGLHRTLPFERAARWQVLASIRSKSHSNLGRHDTASWHKSLSVWAKESKVWESLSKSQASKDKMLVSALVKCTGRSRSSGVSQYKGRLWQTLKSSS